MVSLGSEHSGFVQDCGERCDQSCLSVGLVQSQEQTQFALEMHMRAYFYRAVQTFLFFSTKVRKKYFAWICKINVKLTVVVLVWIIVRHLNTTKVWVAPKYPWWNWRYSVEFILTNRCFSSLCYLQFIWKELMVASSKVPDAIKNNFWMS